MLKKMEIEIVEKVEKIIENAKQDCEKDEIVSEIETKTHELLLKIDELFGEEVANYFNDVIQRDTCVNIGYF